MTETIDVPLTKSEICALADLVRQSLDHPFRAAFPTMVRLQEKLDHAV